MTREETKEAIKVMQAFVDGKEIECYYSGSEKWEKNCNPSWNFYDLKYRIKSGPYIRPYKNQKEFLKAMKEHDGWLLNEDFDYATKPVYVDRCGIDIIGGAGPDDNYGYERVLFDKLLEDFTWIDGAACGVMEE